MLEAVLETAAMVIIQLVLVHRVGVLAADLPEERVELVFVARLFEVVDKTDLFAVGLEVRPDVQWMGITTLHLRLSAMRRMSMEVILS